MTIKLFYCYQCKRYYSEVWADVTINTSIRVDEKGKYWLTGEEMPYYEPVSADTFYCPEHDNHNVVEKTVETCPHEWREVPNAWKPHRRCNLCGIDQEGKVTYD